MNKNSFHTQKLYPRLLLAVLFVEFPMLIAGIVGFLKIKNIYDSSEELDQKYITVSTSCNMLEGMIDAMFDSFESDKGGNSYAENPEIVQDTWKIFNGIKAICEGKGIGKDMKEACLVFENEMNNAKIFIEKFLSAKQSENQEEIDIAYKQMQSAKETLLYRVNVLQDTGHNHISNANKQVQSSIKSLFIIVIVCFLLTFFFGAVALTSMDNNIIKPTIRLVDVAKRIANADLVNDVKHNNLDDEISMLEDAFATMTDKLTELMRQLKSTSVEIASASRELSVASGNMSSSANDQASSAEEVSSSIEQMSSSISQNNDNARETEEIAKQNLNTIEICNQSAERSEQSMNQIAQKITIINDIAFQTNILALNAAVEAARAGEHGKGFSVVAAEIRKLAEHCSSAARDIDQTSKESVEIVHQNGEAFSQVLPAIRRTTQLLQEISAACQEQATGSEQINSAVQRFNQITQGFAALAEELNSNSQVLASHADNLLEITDSFKFRE